MSKANNIKLANLRRDIAAGIKALEERRYQTYNDDNIMKLADDVCRDGRRLLRGKVAMKERKTK